MERFEVTGCANDVWHVAAIQVALLKAGAMRVHAHYAYGMSNQPRVATFAAPDEAAAKRICNKARGLLAPGELPALIPYRYNSTNS